MVKLYYKNFKREDIGDIEHGDVIVYDGFFLNNYLIVESVSEDKKEICGNIVYAHGVNSVPLEQLIVE